MTYRAVFWENRATPARFAATLAALIGLVTLCGWAFDYPVMRSLLPGAVQMKANTAVALMLSGFALLVLVEPSSRSLERLAQGLAMAVAALGLVTLCEFLFGWQVGLDQLLVADNSRAYNMFAGRMSPFSAVAFVAVGTALLSMPHPSLQRPTPWLAAAVMLIGVTSLIGYLWNAVELVTDSWLPPVALNTALCLVLLGGGILLSPRAKEARSAQRAALAAVEIKTLAGFLFALSLLLFGGGYTYRNNVLLADSVEWVIHTQEVRTALADLYGSVAGAEVAERDYFLTGEQSSRDEYRRSIGAIEKRLAELAVLTADNPVQQRNLLVLRRIVASRIDATETALATYDQGGLPAAHAANAQAARMQIDRMDAIEARLLTERRSVSGRHRQRTLIALLATLTLASCVFLWLFSVIRREMRAREALEGELQIEARRLEQSNQELESFSYSVSHDLRAPLRAIDGFALMVEEDYSDRLDSEGRRYLSVIRDNSKRMGMLIDNLLGFSRLGRQSVAKSGVDMQALVREVVEAALRDYATPPRIDIGPLPDAHADRGLLRQVWENLISNALKYSSKSAQPVIEVQGQREGTEIRYSVRDNGVGFSMEYASKLFGVFQRLHRADEFAGTGVGLAIVHRVVTRHGGRVWAEGSVGHGAVFSFALPNGADHE